MKEQEINRQWKKILNTMNDGLMLIGPDGSILMVNQAFEKMTGYLSGELMGRPCTILHCDACETSLSKEKGIWCRLFEQGKDVKKRCIIMKKDGAYLPALKNASLLKDERGSPLGAVETITDLSELDRLDKEVDHLSLQLDVEGGFHGIIGTSPVMMGIYQIIEKAAQSDAPVIIFGESGTGKDMVARAVHSLGRRREGPFVHMNCAALNDALLESELFGHAKGSFTGAYRHRIGRFEAAHGGDIFLDEIGDVPLSIQVKLLRVLETRQFERVGDHRPIFADVRIITATNKDLEKLVEERVFREDLFFRINVIPIHMPPLRDRSEDIPAIIHHFIYKLRDKTGKRITGLTQRAMEAMMLYSWPGNVRELKSSLEYAFVIAEEGLIDPHQLPPQVLKGKRRTQAAPKEKNQDRSDKEALISALKESGGNQSEAARILGVNRVTIWNRMKKYGIGKKIHISEG